MVSNSCVSEDGRKRNQHQPFMAFKNLLGFNLLHLENGDTETSRSKTLFFILGNSFLFVLSGHFILLFKGPVFGYAGDEGF